MAMEVDTAAPRLQMEREIAQLSIWYALVRLYRVA